jgi:hypothetical protein
MRPNSGIIEAIELVQTEIANVTIVSSKNIGLNGEEIIFSPAAFGLFTKVFFKYQFGQVASIELFSSEIGSEATLSLESLTNKLYAILKDKTVGGTGKFKINDTEQVYEGNSWVGKLWVDYNTTSIVMLRVENGIATMLITNNGVVKSVG